MFINRVFTTEVFANDKKFVIPYVWS